MNDETPAGVQRFRKKPVVVEMIRWDGNGRSLVSVINAGGDPVHVDSAGRLHFWVAKSNAEAIIALGDWVALEPDGSGVYPVAADVFAATYEPVTDPEVRRWHRDLMKRVGMLS